MAKKYVQRPWLEGYQRISTRDCQVIIEEQWQGIFRRFGQWTSGRNVSNHFVRKSLHKAKDSCWGIQTKFIIVLPTEALRWTSLKLCKAHFSSAVPERTITQLLTKKNSLSHLFLLCCLMTKIDISKSIVIYDIIYIWYYKLFG